MSISRSNARSLSAEASKRGAIILGGQLLQDDGRFVINKTDVLDTLERYAGKNVILIMAEVSEDDTERTRTCLTCGREYSGTDCPHCARVRSRLRGDS